MIKDIKKLFYTLTKAQQAVWVRAIKAGFSPLLTTNNKLLKKRCPVCYRVGLIYSKAGVSYLACSNEHFIKFD